MEQQNTKSRQYLIAFSLVTSLFFLWAFLHNINPILIPHLKKACQLSDTQSALIDTAVYLGYFTIALPAGWFMHKYGYKKGIILGLILYAIGAILFTFAASERTFAFFLVALFVEGVGAAHQDTEVREPDGRQHVLVIAGRGVQHHQVAA